MSASPRTARGFTLVEILIVVTIIVVLIGIAAPAFIGVRRAAVRAGALSQLESMATAIDQFENDFGYLPLLILDDPDVAPADPEWCTSLLAQTDAPARLEAQRYHSIYSLPIYLLGLGALDPDPMGTDPDRHDGHAGPGWRDPGHDRAWGGARTRTTSTHRVAASGEIRGPYIDFEDSELVRPASADLFDFPEDPALGGDQRNSPWRLMTVITDTWGTPIRYYRHWPLRAPGATGDSLLNAPAELVDPRTLASAPASSAEFPASLDEPLAKGGYALLSAGPDRIFSPRGFALQGDDAEGSVEDFLMNDLPARKLLLRDGINDNIRLVR